MFDGASYELEPAVAQGTTIRVFGVGGAGGNAVDHMVAAHIPGVTFVAANTDAQQLGISRATVKLQLGETLTRGQGAGGDPGVGRAAAEESEGMIRETLEGVEMMFLTAGMGGGTGTGAAPVVARVAREMGALTVAVVTRPFDFEGHRRADQALGGLSSLREHVDTLIVIPNQKLLKVVARSTPMKEAFRIADDVLLHAVRGIAGLVTGVGYINLDFKDVQAVMRGKGNAIMGTGSASGADRAVAAANAAIMSPLLDDVSIAGASGILINITGGSDLALDEVDQAASVVTAAAGEDADVFFGAVIDEAERDTVEVTVIATGFGSRDPRSGMAPRRSTRPAYTEVLAGAEADAEIPVGADMRIPTARRRVAGTPLVPSPVASGENGAQGDPEEDDWNWSRPYSKAERHEIPAFMRKRSRP